MVGQTEMLAYQENGRLKNRIWTLVLMFSSLLLTVQIAGGPPPARVSELAKHTTDKAPFTFSVLRLSGGVQGWADFRNTQDRTQKSKRQTRVEKGRLIKSMKKKFKISKRRREKRHLRRTDEADKTDPENDQYEHRSVVNQKPMKPSTRAWTASEEDSTLEIFDRNGNRIPVHAGKELRWQTGSSGIYAPH